MAYENEVAFLRKAREDESILHDVKMLLKNDWDGLKKIAEKAGFKDLTLKGLKTVLPTKFYTDSNWEVPREKKAQLKKKKEQEQE